MDNSTFYYYTRQKEVHGACTSFLKQETGFTMEASGAQCSIYYLGVSGMLEIQTGPQSNSRLYMQTTACLCKPG